MSPPVFELFQTTSVSPPPQKKKLLLTLFLPPSLFQGYSHRRGKEGREGKHSVPPAERGRGNNALHPSTPKIHLCRDWSIAHFYDFFSSPLPPPSTSAKNAAWGGKSQLSNFEGKIAAVAFPLLFFPPMGGGRVAGFGMGCYYAEMSSPLSPPRKSCFLHVQKLQKLKATISNNDRLCCRVRST